MVIVRNCSVDMFLEMAEHRQLICFCAGQKLREFCERFHLEDRILYVVDNFKNGGVFRYGSCDIPILSMAQLDSRCREALCVVTSMGAAVEMISRLDSLSVCEGIDVYIYELLTGAGGSLRWEKEGRQVIPKKIHYCWFGGGKLPEHFQRNIESWRRQCPDYEITEWNERNYDVAKNKYMKQAYDHKKWGFVPDYARLDIVNTHGGLYFDTDVRMLKSFDMLLQYEFFCGFESGGGINLGQGFGAVRNHVVIQDMLNAYDDLEFVRADGSINTVPSPVYQTAALERWGLKKNGMLQQTRQFLVLPSEFFSPVNEFGYGNLTENTFSIHQYAATWYDPEQQKHKEKMIQDYEMIQKRIGE